MIESVRNSVKRTFKILGTGALLALVFFQVADAAYPPIYDVEIIVFLNNNDSTGDEYLKIHGPDHSPEHDRAFPEGEFTELSYKFYQLTNISESLEESSDYNVLFHRAWRQLAYDSTHAVPYPLDSLVNNESKSVAGSVKLEMESDLYLDVDVLLMSRKIPSDPSTKRPIRQLMEKQRIESEQIYYFNQPNLGIIAKVTPYRKNANEKSRRFKNLSFLSKLLAASTVARMD